MSTHSHSRGLVPHAPGVLRSILAPVFGVLMVLTLAAPVQAHAELVSSDPANKAVLATPPATITLTFSEDLDASKSSFKLLGPAGTVGTGKVAGTATAMSLEGLSLAPGDYTIEWTSMALDGDLLRGTLTFTVAASTPSGGPSTAAPSTAPSAPPAASPATPSPSPSADGAIQAASGDATLPIIAALVIVGVVGLFVLRRSRRA